MKKTLNEQIAANKRASTLYAIFMVILLTALGTSVVGAFYPREWYLGTAGSFILGIILAIVARTSGPSIILSISHAREANAQEDQMLRNVVEEMAIAGGIPVPKIYVIDDAAPNAFATGSDPDNAVVCITTGLYHKLDRDELQGVIAHEMSHIRNYDIRFMATISLIAGAIPLIADTFLRVNFWGGGRRSSRDKDGLGSVFMIIGLVLSVLAPVCSRLLELAVSRQREYLADAGAAEMTRYPEGLARALQKIESDPTPLAEANRATQHLYIVNPLQRVADRAQSLFSTHPPTADRIYRLMHTMGAGDITPPDNPPPPVGS